MGQEMMFGQAARATGMFVPMIGVTVRGRAQTRRSGMSLTLRILGLLIACSVWQIEAAPARSLEVIRAHGTLHLCAHPNSLPYASKAGSPPRFQIELGEMLAEELGVSLVTEWRFQGDVIGRGWHIFRRG